MFQKFKNFIMRGSVLDMAVGVMMASALNEVVSALTSSFLDPLIQLVMGKNSVDGLIFRVPGTEVVFPYGNFIQAVINFLLIALVLFLILQGVAKAEKMAGIERPVKNGTPEEQYLKEIRDLLREQSKESEKSI